MNLLWSNGFWSFFFLTIVLGGAAAWMTGRAVAMKWESLRQLGFYCLLLALAVQFLHFALFEAPLLSARLLIINLVVLAAIGFVGFRITRVGLMVSQYPWQYERSGLFAWRERGAK